MKIVFLSGRPASGKLTVARELAALTGWRLFHNHLVVDALLAVFEFGSAPFVELREKIWSEVFARASAAGVPALIFTFSPENTVRQAFIDDFETAARARGDTVHFVALTCPDAEIERRLDTASRRTTHKLTSAALYRELVGAGSFDSPRLPPPSLTVDTDALDAAAAAKLIRDRLG